MRSRIHALDFTLAAASLCITDNILIDTAGKAKQIECAMQFYNEMRAAHLTPTVSTCILAQRSTSRLLAVDPSSPHCASDLLALATHCSPPTDSLRPTVTSLIADSLLWTPPSSQRASALLPPSTH